MVAHVQPVSKRGRATTGAATEPDTAAVLVLRSRRSNLHLQHFPVVHFTVYLKAYPNTNHRPSFTILVGPAIDDIETWTCGTERPLIRRQRE
jgi:hypothetical protein